MQRVDQIKNPYGLQAEFTDKASAEIYLKSKGFLRDPYYLHCWYLEAKDTDAHLCKVREFAGPDTWLVTYHNARIERLRSMDKPPKKLGLRLVEKLEKVGANYGT